MVTRLTSRSAVWRLEGAILLLALAACHGDPLNPEPQLMPAEVIVVPAEVTVLQGLTVSLDAVVILTNGDTVVDPNVLWFSSDSAIASVTERGLVRGQALGTVHISASIGELTGISEVIVVSEAGDGL